MARRRNLPTIAHQRATTRRWLLTLMGNRSTGSDRAVEHVADNGEFSRCYETCIHCSDWLLSRIVVELSRLIEINLKTIRCRDRSWQDKRVEKREWEC